MYMYLLTYFHNVCRCAQNNQPTNRPMNILISKHKLNRFCSVFQEYIPLIKMAFPLIFFSLSILFWLLCNIFAELTTIQTIYNSAIENQNSNYFSSFGYNNNSTNTNNGNANTQWSVWQQFPWPYIQPEQNRWSKCVSQCVCTIWFDYSFVVFLLVLHSF